MTHGLQSLRRARSLLLTLRLGDLPEHIPSWTSVREFGVAPVEHIDGGLIDRLLRHHGGAARSARLHRALKPRQACPGVKGARRFDELEQITGVARVLRIEVADDAGVDALVDALSQVALVESVRPDWLCSVPFDIGPSSTATSRIDLEAAWRMRELVQFHQALGYEPGSPSVKLGLADTGVFSSHAELDARLSTGFDTVDLTQQDVGSLQLVGDNTQRDEEPNDEVGHGTGCAGILSANGLMLPPGSAGLCGLVPVRVLGAVRSGEGRVGIGALNNIDAGMKRLIDLGVKVINMSFGTAASALRPGDALPHDEVVRYALARGVLLVAASGNSGIEELYYPAAYPGVIAVGSIDVDLRPSRFSTRGDHVTLCAPGRKVWTCGLDGYREVSGTSFAAPLVAAACALLASRAERRAWPLTPDVARDLLMRSARPFRHADVQGCGAGVLDVLAALQLLDEHINRSLDDDES